MKSQTVNHDPHPLRIRRKRTGGRYRLLDLFCGAGGCSVGYHRAGFEVIGVDNRPQPSYPFEFYQADAMTFPLDGFDVIHASPPCQAYSVTSNMRPGCTRHPDMIKEVRERISNRPYVIENVPGSPLKQGSVLLCGLMFGLRVYRHRLFESNHALSSPPHHPKHHGKTFSHTYSSFKNGADIICAVGNAFNRKDGADAMGISWMRVRKEVAQAIPPAYTEWIGRQIINALDAADIRVAQ